MKNIYYGFLLLLSTIIMFACNDDLRELNKGEEPLALTISDAVDSLSEANVSENGITFNWTTGTNSGTSAAISYMLEIAPSGSNFVDAYYVDLGQDIYKLSYTEEQLNDILLDELLATPAKEAQFEARITATVANDNVEPQTSTTTFTVKPYEPVTKTLYLVGNATPNGWDVDNATAMTRTDNGVFSWTGRLTKGNFKFITTLGSMLPSYNRDESSSSNALIYRNDVDDPDEQYTVDSTNTYTVSVNLLNLTTTIKASKDVVAPYSMIYFVGSFTDWNFIEMTPDPLSSFIFRYGAVLNWNNGGEFKFGTASGSWNNMYHPTEASASYTSTSVQQDDEGDYKWVLTEAQCGKPYKMYLDITPGAEYFHMEEFTPYAGLYLVGDATPNGWDLTDATAMTAMDAYTFTWTGTLSTGEFKISCDKQSDWNGAWFMASESDKNLTEGNEVITFVDKSISGNSNIDRKWNVSMAGSYTLTLNQLTEKMTIVKN